MTQLDILHAAYAEILRQWDVESSRQERGRKENRPTPIADARVEKLNANLDELHDMIWRLEWEEACKA